MYCNDIGMGVYRPCYLFIKPCGYIDTTYVARIKHISKRALKVINCKVRTVKRLQRARESHRKVFLEEGEEE